MRNVVLVAAAALLASVCAATAACADDVDGRMRPVERRVAEMKPEQLTAGEVEALRRRLAQCWDLPVVLKNASGVTVMVRIDLNLDGSLARPPAVINHSQHPLFRVAAESALRAVRKCAPFTALPTAKYDAWKTIEVNFDARSMS